MAGEQGRGSSGAPSAGGTPPGGVGTASTQDFATKHEAGESPNSLEKMAPLHRMDSGLGVMAAVWEKVVAAEEELPPDAAAVLYGNLWPMYGDDAR
jgi:hypothetical protein